MRLEKYHGCGNDFLVLLDLNGRQPVEPALAKFLCDRHRGIGADGFIAATKTSADLMSPERYAMLLFNADGSRAEMSGNGIRCLARALVDVAGERATKFDVVTDAGLRTVKVNEDGTVTVTMGAAQGMRYQTGPRGGREAVVSMGNPHVVVEVSDPAGVDLGAEAAGRGLVNVEVITVGPGPDELSMRVHERGVGETQACGTGACAAAFVAHSWGLVGSRVVVHQPGGDVTVDLTGPEITLGGPAVHVGSVEVHDVEGQVAPWR